MAERLRALLLNHSIISPLCLVWVRAPLWPHVRQQKFCLRVCQVVFLGVLPFSPHLLIGPSHMSRNNLKRDVKLNKTNKLDKISWFKISYFTSIAYTVISLLAMIVALQDLIHNGAPLVG